MNIPLNDFEEYIGETILSRGLSYFENGYVNEPDEITRGVYETIVEGSENYTVRLTLNKGMITEYSCDCPYDMGPICKHIVAFMFYLQQEELGKEDFTSPKKTFTKSKKQRSSKKKTIAEQVDDLLTQIPHEELKNFIRAQFEKDSTLRNIFMASFAYLNANESKSFYVKQLRSIIRSASERDGFISWHGTGKVSAAVSEYLSAAQKHIEQANLHSAIYICSSIMEEMVDVLAYCDDSNGDIGGCFENALDILRSLSEEILPEEIRIMLFEYFIDAYRKGIYSEWGWHLDMLSIASYLIANENEAEEILSLLEKSPLSDYQQESALQIKLHIIKKTKGDEEAEKLIEMNLSYPSFRHDAITKAMDAKNYERAIVLAQEGIKKDSKDKPGLATDWKERLLDIAVAQNDKNKIIEYSRELYLNGFSHDRDHYQLLKDNIEKDEWFTFVEQMIEDLIAAKHWRAHELMASIFINEKWWPRLMKMVTEYPELHYIETYEQHLAKEFPKEIADLYAKGVVKFLGENAGRNHYKTACKYLKRMKQLGAAEDVIQIISNLRKKYPQRKALLEELSKV
jgi:uncharacterized Zn finger protein